MRFWQSRIVGSCFFPEIREYLGDTDAVSEVPYGRGGKNVIWWQ